MTAMPRIGAQDRPKPKGAGLLLGEDWVTPDSQTDQALRASRGRRGLVSLKRSPLARKIIVFNLLALVVLVAGVLFLNPFRDSLVTQREQGFVTEARLLSSVLEARLSDTDPADPAVPEPLAGVDISPGACAFPI